MNTANPTPMNPITPHDSLLAICLYAAFSKGEQSETERKEIARYAEEMDADNLAVLSRGILMGKLSIEQACQGVGDQLTGSALSFASTYAIGHMAQSYYAGGRTLTAPDLKKFVGPLQSRARELHTRYLPEIQERAKTLDSAAVLSLVRGKSPV